MNAMLTWFFVSWELYEAFGTYYLRDVAHQLEFQHLVFHLDLDGPQRLPAPNGHAESVEKFDMIVKLHANAVSDISRQHD